jgi:spore germination cell wall hydrolase CwlJ-like protein
MSFVGDLITGQSQKNISKYNASLMERDAQVLEQKAQQGYKVYEKFDLPQIYSLETKSVGDIRTGYAIRGVTEEGTGIRVLMDNALNFARDRDMLEYNALVKKEQLENEAVMKRAEARVERYRGQVAETISYFKAGSSLLGDVSTGQKIYKGMG